MFCVGYVILLLLSLVKLKESERVQLSLLTKEAKAVFYFHNI